MRTPDTPSWRQIIGESLWRKRAVVKAVHVWLPIAVIANVDPFVGGATFAGNAVRLFVAAACYVTVSILANDLADRADDESAGKSRPVTRMSGGTPLILLIFVTIIGGLFLLVSDMPRGVSLVYGAAILTGLLYSLRPTRLKGRGILGPVTYSFSTTLAYLVMPWVGLAGDHRILLALAPAMMLDKWVHLHFHQVIDYDADCRSGVRTLAVALGLPRTREGLLWASRIASVFMLAAMLWVVCNITSARLVMGLICAISATVVLLYVRRARRDVNRSSALLRSLPEVYLALSYTLFRVLPLALLFALSLGNRLVWILFLLAAVTVVIEARHMVAYRYE